MNLFSNHEAFECIKTLLQRRQLSRRHVLLLEKHLELCVLKRSNTSIGSVRLFLLFQSQVSQNALDDMQVKRDALRVIYCHQGHHALGIQIALIQAKRLNGHMRDSRVYSLYGEGVSVRSYLSVFTGSSLP